MIILGERCIYQNRFGQKLNICNFKKNLFHIRLVESDMAIKFNVSCEQIKKKNGKRLMYEYIYYVGMLYIVLYWHSSALPLKICNKVVQIKVLKYCKQFQSFSKYWLLLVCKCIHQQMK